MWGFKSPLAHHCCVARHPGRVSRDQRRFTLAHDLDDLSEDAVPLGGQGDLLTVRPQQEAGLGVVLDEAREVEQLVEVLGREDQIVLATAALDRD